MKQSIYNSFKHDKKLKHLERKKQRSNKRKGLVFWSNVEIINQNTN